MMSGLDGYAVLAKLKANAATAEIPIMFLTAVAGCLGVKYGVERLLPQHRGRYDSRWQELAQHKLHLVADSKRPLELHLI
jgi:CheY-like chemotaxis protein